MCPMATRVQDRRSSTVSSGLTLHSMISYLTPIEKENAYYAQTDSEQHPLIGELTLH